MLEKFSIVGFSGCQEVEKSIASSSGQGALARLGPFGARKILPSASVYGLFFIL